MENVFHAKGRHALAAVVAKRPLLIFDLDGTLVGLQKHRPASSRTHVTHTFGKAHLDAKTKSLLTTLQEYLPVTILTGRHVADAKRVLNWEPTFLIGNHGSEGHPALTHLLPDLEKNATRLKKAFTELLSTADLGKWWIEEKTYTFTIHCASKKAIERLHSELKRENIEKKLKCDILRAKGSLNILPKGAPSKGMAVKALLKRLGVRAAIFLGDDATDETVFRLKNKAIFGVHIGRGPTEAEFRISSQHNVLRFLQLLIFELEKEYSKR